MLAIAVLCGVSARARATQGPAPPGDVAWDHAEAALVEARRGVAEAGLRCAADFLALHVGLPREHPRAAESLHKAAQCHHAAGRWDEAAALYQRLVDGWPEDDRARLALAALAVGYTSVARYAEAADSAEDYAARYPADEQTPELLRTASWILVEIGPRDRALAVLDRLEALYLRHDPTQAAQIFWLRGALMRDDRERIAHVLAYLKRHGRSGPRDLLLVATARLGELEWRAACEQGLLLDLCVTVWRGRAAFSDEGRVTARALRQRVRRRRPPDPAPPTCAGPGTPRVIVYARDPRRAAEARRRLAEALQLERSDPRRLRDGEGSRLHASRHAVSMAAIHLLDAEFEELLAQEVPSGLDLGGETDDPARRRRVEASRRRLARYLADTGARAEDLERRYGEVAATDASTEAAIVALYRVGQIAEYRAADLLRAPLPRDLRAPEAVASFCATLQEAADPGIARALAAYAACLERARTSGEFTAVAGLCESSLHSLDPRRWPATVELFGDAVPPPSRPIAIGVIEEVPSELRE
ncbi:MAG: hypothetical protein R3B09_09280 [Nannocystaceae bacterium]